MEDRVGAGRHALQADAAVGRMEQRQRLGRALAQILVGKSRRIARGSPGLARIGGRLARLGLVGVPDRQAHRLAFAIGILNQFFSRVAKPG